MATGILERILAALGRRPRTAAAPTSTRELFLYLPVGDSRVLVGILQHDDGAFVFRYSDEFRARTDLPPISAFPDREAIYRSAALWPFFDVRLPPIERPDIEEAVREKRVDTNDVFALLAEFGRKTVTTPYEFERHRLDTLRHT